MSKATAVRPFDCAVHAGIYIGYTVKGGQPMVAKVQRWGNSQGLRLAKHVLERARIAIGDDVEVIAGEGEIVIRKLRKPKYDLAEMVSRMPRKYKAREESFGKPVGKEEW